MPRHIHPDDDKVFACPACDGAGEVYRRTHENKEFDKPFRCHKCGHEFDDVVERDAREWIPADEPASPTDDDGLPAALDDDMKEVIRSARGS